ncbi:MAG: prepilin-type N-terminal cleavage/methylation domain-containing protein [Desulfobacteraceae bacterium]|nr:MAG: prepilin-type N-terminal cleavage/methylation domain-containing protein [Desulfobacteraceae bacterium]
MKIVWNLVLVIWNFCRRPTAAAGFTLLELMVVTLLTGIFLTVISLRIENVFSGGDLRLASRIIIGRINQARAQAVYTRTEQVIGLNVDRNSFYKIKPEDSGKQSAYWTASDLEEGEMPLPQGVRLEDVTVLTRGKIQEGEARIRFFANGCIERSLIHLRNEADQSYTLEINPLTGSVKLHDRYIEQRVE